MLMNRIMGAFTFRKGVYAEVERDTSFTSTAWLLVTVVAFLNQLGANSAGSPGMGKWLLGALLGTAFTVLGFALAAYIISWVGSSVFNAETNFEEMVRTLGLAYVWNVIGFVGILALLSPTLVCLLSPVILLGALLGFVAWLIAIKEALDLDWIQTIITLAIGLIVNIIISILAGLVLGIFGLSAAGLFSLFGS